MVRPTHGDHSYDFLGSDPLLGSGHPADRPRFDEPGLGWHRGDSDDHRPAVFGGITRGRQISLPVRRRLIGRHRAPGTRTDASGFRPRNRLARRSESVGGSGNLGEAAGPEGQKVGPRLLDRRAVDRTGTPVGARDNPRGVGERLAA